MIKSKIYKFSSIATFNPGQSPSSKFYNQNIGTPFYKVIEPLKNLFPLIDTYTTQNTKIADKDDILISVRAPVGDLNIANKKFVLEEA